MKQKFKMTEHYRFIKHGQHGLKMPNGLKTDQNYTSEAVSVHHYLLPGRDFGCTHVLYALEGVSSWDSWLVCI